MNRYSVHIICEVSLEVGMGHLVRSCLLASQLELNGKVVKVSVISTGLFPLPQELDNINLNYISSNGLNEILLTDPIYDIYVLDLLELSETTQLILSNLGSPLLGLSYVNNYSGVLNIYIGRIRVDSLRPQTVYNVDVRNCIYYQCESRLNERKYIINVTQDVTEIGIFMSGGTDIVNYKKLIQAVSATKCDFYLKIIVGQTGLKLMHEIQRLMLSNGIARFNIKEFNGIESSWNFLSQCGFILCSGGLTAFESVHKGLPFICFAQKEHQYNGVADLVEMGCGFSIRAEEHDSIPALSNVVKYLLSNRYSLEYMNRQCIHSFKYDGAGRVVNIIDNYMHTLLNTSCNTFPDKLALHA